MLYYIQTIAKRTKLSWAKSSLNSKGTEDEKLLNISSY